LFIGQGHGGFEEKNLIKKQKRDNSEGGGSGARRLGSALHLSRRRGLSRGYYSTYVLVCQRIIELIIERGRELRGDLIRDEYGLDD
jgi:hypothetical protein